MTELNISTTNRPSNIPPDNSNNISNGSNPEINQKVVDEGAKLEKMANGTNFSENGGDNNQPLNHTPLQEGNFFSNKFAEWTAEDTYLGAGFKFLSDNSTYFLSGVGIVGGGIAVDAGINLLRKVKKEEVNREIVRFVTGAVVIGGSLYMAKEDALSKLLVLNATLASGLVVAAYKAINATKPTYLVYQINFNDIRPVPQNVTNLTDTVKKEATEEPTTTAIKN